ncbi:condensation domain-containing protein [Chitinophaga sancti]|uniref:Condensation domain-containing protein n=1 Tax=Chitinophaga sancti TaxID=1004 RepID=A0A1K1Q4P6_9BACT|nr:condensation domain-containing protein [Chitinophaga sancti]WQD61133.1 condensation domain-containing protein [Chitinophaga sancti]WQG86740.1 condensation domain-containing protein [Chitinophaga sancti]SFW54994.1 Condensation domain-containing protein [Chitinophaga sancti]
MNRKLTVGERIMYVSSEAPVNCIFPVKIKGQINRERLEQALLKLQQKHPLLRVVIREDEKGAPYYVTDTQIAPVPVDIRQRYTNDDWQQVSVNEWYKPFNVSQGPLARVVWLKSDSVSELLLICPHCICDGSSILTLLRELLMVLDNPLLELSPYESFEAIEDLLPAALLANKKFRLRGLFFGKIAQLVLWFKTRRLKPVTTRGYLLNWKLSQELSNTLVHRCKEEGTTLFSAIAVAFLDAFRQVRPTTAHNKLICPVDIRRFVPEIAADELFAFAPIVELSAEMSALNDFWTRTRSFKNELMAKIDKINIHELLYMGEYFHGSLPRMLTYLKTTDGTHDVTLSNMGKLQLPEKFDTFELETVYSPSAGFPWRNPNTLVASTYKGLLDFTFISNEAFLPESDARAIQMKAIAILQEKSRIKQTYGVKG